MAGQTSTENQTKSIEEELEEYLAMQQQTQSEQAPMGQTAVPVQTPAPEPEDEEPENPILRGDLLSQIAAIDIKNEKEEKKKQRKQISFSKIFSIFMMRATLTIDEIRHKYASVFHLIAFLWSFIVVLIYIGGLVSLGILIYAYMNYPNYVRHYFNSNNIELSSYDVRSYTLSQIELSNIKAKDDSYSIRRAVIRSNFSDFLRGRIKAVTLEGAVIKIREKNNQFEMSGLVKLLMQLNQGKSKYHIGSISIPNAILNIEGEKYKLPVALSVNGIYDKAPNVTIPLSIKHDYMNISAQLSMTGVGQNLEWTLDITSGNLSFPNRQPENISGKFKIRTEKISIASINGTLDLVYGKNNKKIKVDLKRNKDVYRGIISLSLANMEVRDKADETKTNIQMVFEGLDIKSFSRITSSKSIRLSVQSFYTQDLSVTNAVGTFKGDLECRNFICSYQIKSNTPVSIQSSRLNYYGNTYSSTEKSQLMLKPTGRTSFKWGNDGMEFDLSVTDASYSGTNNTKNNRIKVNAKKMELVGVLSDKNSQSKMKFLSSGTNYSSNDVAFSDAVIRVNNIWDETGTLHFKSPTVTLKNNRLLKVPFAIDMRRDKGVLGASLGMLNNKLQVRYVGAANLLTGSFVGNVAVLPFDLKNITGNLNAVSDVFPAFAEQVSGKLAVYGKIAWKSEKQVDGPFYLMAEDVNFNVGNIRVNGLNTVLVVQSLVPFVTTGGQEVFVKKVDSILPFRNIHTTLKFDNQMMRIARLNMSLSGMDLAIDNLIIPYKATSTTVYLRNSEADFASMNNYFKINGLSAEGKGNIVLPIEIKKKSFNLLNGEVRFSNVSLKYTGQDSQIRNALFKNSDEYLLKTGNALLSQGQDNQLSAYLNFDGRMLPDQIKSNFSDTVRFNPLDVFAPSQTADVPALIQERQNSIKRFLEKQK